MKHFDFIVIGSGFGSLFFLHKLTELQPDAKIAVIEWGSYSDYQWQILNKRNSSKSISELHEQPLNQKPWNYTIGFGGGTNCWFGQSMRLIPSDFRMKSIYGVMNDWPFSYEQLEPFYQEAEDIMLISGSNAMKAVSPRSGSFPFPHHRLNSVDEIMIAANPDHHFPIATARASVANRHRGKCCATAKCNLCPVDAKFTAFNGLQYLIDNPQISYFFDSEVKVITHKNNKATGIKFTTLNGNESELHGDVVVLGANAIHSPAILLRSGINHPWTGSGICEQLGAEYEILLDGLDSFNGGTITTSLNYSLYDGPHRSEKGAALLFFENRLKYGLRNQFGRWRQYFPLIVNVEDAVQQSNTVTISDKGKAFVDHPSISRYAKDGLSHAETKLPEVLSPLPVEKIMPRGIRNTESHIQCSLRSGNNLSTSVVDGQSLHHTYRNLIVVGSSTFTTCPPANPSLTVAAMSLRAAQLWVEGNQS